MAAKFGEIIQAGGTLHMAAVRTEGVLMRPVEGTLAEAGDAGAAPVPVSMGEDTHMVTLPAGSLALEVTDGSSHQFVVRLPRGTLLSIQPLAATVDMKRMVDGAEDESTTTTHPGLANLTLLDPVRRAVDLLMGDATAGQDVGGARLGLVGEYPAALGLRVFPWIIKFKNEQMEAEFAVVQGFVVPPGTRGVVTGRRTVALVRDQPLVMSGLVHESCRHQIEYALREPMRHAPPEIAAMWEQTLPPMLADYSTILEAIGPVHSVWCASGIREAWTRLDRAAAG